MIIGQFLTRHFTDYFKLSFVLSCALTYIEYNLIASVIHFTSSFFRGIQIHLHLTNKKHYEKITHYVHQHFYWISMHRIRPNRKRHRIKDFSRYRLHFGCSTGKQCHIRTSIGKDDIACEKPFSVYQQRKYQGRRRRQLHHPKRAASERLSE